MATKTAEETTTSWRRAIGSVALAMVVAGCAAGAATRGWPGVGATRSGPDAGCPPIMSHFEDWSNNYGTRDRKTTSDPAWNKPHNGIDFDVPVGTPVLAAAPGMVTELMYSDLSPVGAVSMVLSHGQDTDGKHVLSFYSHLSQQLRKPGDRVARGEVIALSGTSGTREAHLHLGLWRVAVRPGTPEFRMFLQRAVGRNDRAAVLADPALYWVTPQRPGFDPGGEYAERPIRLTYPLPCQPPR